MNKLVWTGVIALAAGVVAGGCLAYAGVFNVAADNPHWEVTTRALTWVRERGIASQSTGITAPNLADRQLIALGAEHYSAMCEGCHLAPGVGDNELRQGLNPKPPDLTQPRERGPAATFWVIKHGIKMSAMPAWGVTHDDEAIWGLVAFVRQLPSMDLAEYRALTGSGDAPGPAEAAEGHEHEHHADDHAQPDESGAGSKHPEAGAPHQHVHADGKVHTHKS
jgi:mono/diheme cytochrome c family protein